MSEHDEDAVVARIAEHLFVENEALHYCEGDAVVCWGDIGIHGRAMWVDRAILILAALKPGDRLPGGLRVVPEEPSPWMLEASWQATKNATCEERMEAIFASGVDAHKRKMAQRYRAMLAASTD